jgi:hypothetical protein
LRAELSVLNSFSSFGEASYFAKIEAPKRMKTLTLRHGLQGKWEVCTSFICPINEFLLFAQRCGHTFAGNASAKLRTLCLEMGLTPAGWRFIHRFGSTAYKAVVQTSAAQESNFENALSYVAWQVQGGLNTPLPEQLGEKYLLTMGLVLELEHEIDPRLAHVAYLHWQTLNEVDLQEEFAEQQWVQVLVWMRDQSPKLDNNQWRAGWPVIWRKFKQWQKLHSAEDHWSSALGELSVGNWRVVPLTCSYEVALEGMAMKNCVAVYATQCLTGKYRLFSIRSTETGKRVATVGLEKNENNWDLEQVKGKCNKNVTQELCDVALVVKLKYILANSRIECLQPALL